MDSFVGPYRIIRLINRGGQGSVYLGYDKRLHRKVAIKIYRLPSTRAARKQLRREAQLVAGIQSPKVVQIHDVIESNTHLAMVMEYVRGCSLEEFLTAARPSLASVLTVGVDVVAALALARQNHIVHGDVKAGNVLITDSGHVKLTDFGISRTTSEDTSGHWAAGSMTALSPEQFLGRPLDERSDLFALGSLLYRLLCGQHAFIRGDRLDTDLLLRRPHQPMSEITTGEVVLPGPLVDVIDALLQKEPQDRPPNTRCVRQVLREELRSLPVAIGNSLLREAYPHFRHESPEDLPPRIPKGLGQHGRSALVPAGSVWVKLVHRLKSTRWPARTVLSLMLLAMVAVPLVITVQNRVTPVRFTKPVTDTAKGVLLPRNVAPVWMVEQVRRALLEQLGHLRIIGPRGAFEKTVVYSGGAPNNWNENAAMEVDMALRCAGELCVFSISREQRGTRRTAQSVVLADMSTYQWSRAIQDATLELYD